MIDVFFFLAFCDGRAGSVRQHRRAHAQGHRVSGTLPQFRPGPVFHRVGLRLQTEVGTEFFFVSI